MTSSDVREGTALREILLYLWSGRVIVVLFTITFFVIGYAYIWVASRTYEATVVFAPAASSGAAGSADASLLASAAHLIGISGPTSTTTEFTKFTSLLTSDVLAAELVKNHPILQKVYAGQWDKTTKTWHPPSGIGAHVSAFVGSLIGMPSWSPPNYEKLAAYLSANVVVTPDANTGLLEVTFDSSDRVFAIQLLTWMHDDADSLLRQTARTQTANRITYLKKTLPTVTIADQRNALIALLSQMMQTNMIIESDPNWAAVPLDPPSLAANPIWPKPLLIIPASIVVGMIAGICMFLFLTQMEVDMSQLTFGSLWRMTRRRRTSPA